MGDDYTNRHLLLEGRTTTRDDIVEVIRVSMRESGYMEDYTDAANRRIAIGPDGKWITLYDSAGNGEDWDQPAFERLSKNLSKLVPVVDTHMDDSATVHFTLWLSGSVVDRFDSGHAIGQPLAEENRFSINRIPGSDAPPSGHPDLWALVLQDASLNDTLKSAWNKTRANEILGDVADTLGWHPLYSAAGYTIDYDGVPVYFREHFEDDGLDVSGFTEMHFRRRSR